MTIQEKLKKYRGKAYGKAVIEAWALYSDSLKHKAAKIKATGKFTPLDIYRLSLEFDFSFKLTTEFLQELTIISTGTYERMIRGGIKVKDLKAKYNSVKK